MLEGAIFIHFQIQECKALQKIAGQVQSRYRAGAEKVQSRCRAGAEQVQRIAIKTVLSDSVGLKSSSVLLFVLTDAIILNLIYKKGNQI